MQGVGCAAPAAHVGFRKPRQRAHAQMGRGGVGLAIREGVSFEKGEKKMGGLFMLHSEKTGGVRRKD